jgi:ankyrin repeat protein
MKQIHSLLLKLSVLCIAAAVFVNSPAYAAEADQLYKAAQNGDIQTVKGLLDKGVSVNTKSSTGSYAINAAAIRNDLAMMRLLVSRGADLNVQNRDGDTPLICATKYGGGKAATIELLVEAGADTAKVDSDGKTALAYAKQKKQNEAARLLEK